MKLYVTITGLVATALTTVSLFPQILKTRKTKSDKDIAIKMHILFSVNVFACGLFMEF